MATEFDPKILVRMLASVCMDWNQSEMAHQRYPQPLQVGDAVMEAAMGQVRPEYSTIGIVTQIVGDGLFPDQIVIDTIEGKSVSWENCMFTKLSASTAYLVRTVVQTNLENNNGFE